MGWIFLSLTLIICWLQLILKIWAKSELVEFLADFCGVYPENLSQIRVGYVFGWFWGVCPPPLFAKKLDFCSGVVKIFVTNFDHLLVLAYPENLSQIGVGWVLCWFGVFYPPLFSQKNGFWFRWGKIFCHQLWSFIGFSLPWKFEPNPSWLSFWLIWGGLHCRHILVGVLERGSRQGYDTRWKQ